MKKNEDKHCGVCEMPYFERNKYYYGKLMTARDFYAEQCYFNEKRWLMNRMVLGWGVVCGLDVHFEGEPASECIAETECHKLGDQCKIVIEPGLAIDCCGREILVCEKQELSLDDVEPPCSPEKGRENDSEDNYVICLEYRECESEAVHTGPAACDQKEKFEYNRVRDSFRIRLRYESDIKIPEQTEGPCPLTDLKNNAKKPSNRSHHTEKRACDQYETIHEYLCNKARKGCPDCAEHACLCLAKVKASYHEDRERKEDTSRQDIQQQQSERPKISRTRIELDPCSCRRLVYGNKLLYDLIHCYHDDLPHIVEISWKDYHADNCVNWKEFVKNVLTPGFIVTFDRKMDAATINRHTFLISLTVKASGTGTVAKMFIPAKSIEPFKIKKGDIIDECKFIFMVQKYWISDEWDLKEGEEEARPSEFDQGTDVEITLRSSLILDKYGKALDGDFIGGKFPTGNGSQGGDFISWFSVRPKTEKKSDDQKPVGEEVFEDV